MLVLRRAAPAGRRRKARHSPATCQCTIILVAILGVGALWWMQTLQGVKGHVAHAPSPTHGLSGPSNVLVPVTRHHAIALGCAGCTGCAYTPKEEGKQCTCRRTLGHEAHMPCNTRLVAAWLSAPVKLVQKPFCAAPAPPPPDAGQLLGAQYLHALIQHKPGRRLI